MAEWGRMSHLLCLIANVNRDPKARSRAYTPAEFDPHATRADAREVVETVSVKELKGVLLGMKPMRRKRED